MKNKQKFILPISVCTIAFIIYFSATYVSTNKAPEGTLEERLTEAITKLKDPHHTEEEHDEIDKLIESLPVVNDIMLDGSHSINSEVSLKLMRSVLYESLLKCDGINYELTMVNEKEDTIELFYRTSSPTESLTDFKVEHYILYLVMNEVDSKFIKDNDKLLRIHFYYSEDENRVPDVSDMVTDIILLSEADTWADYRDMVFGGPDSVELYIAGEGEKDTLQINRYE